METLPKPPPARRRGLIETAGDALVLTDAVFAAIGQQRSVPPDDFVVDGYRLVSNPVGNPLKQVAYDEKLLIEYPSTQTQNPHNHSFE